ncbi:uncharacterized protein LOC125179466, partial [Hyalella azteca]|uniref:Uncharacterized protein LOC125179466 n=1 Tax=Hyalella azteca TaxID=294128 RepID=A0A979FVR6_HYAAZ
MSPVTSDPVNDIYKINGDPLPVTNGIRSDGSQALPFSNVLTSADSSDAVPITSSTRIDAPSDSDEVTKTLIETSCIFHVTNVILHACVTVSYVTMLRHAAVSRVVAVAAGAVFAVHPVHCEAVASLVGRAELLAALCFSLALSSCVASCRASFSHNSSCRANSCRASCASFCSASGRAWGGWSLVGWAALGVLCKEQAITAVPVGLLLQAAHLLVTTPPGK